MGRRIIISLSFVLSFTFSFGQELLTLEDAIRIAMENNYEIRIAGNSREIAGNNVSIGNAGMLPEVDVEVFQNNSIDDFKQQRITGETVEMSGAKEQSFTAGAYLNWTIFDGLGMFITYKKLKELRNLQQLDFRMTVENTIAQVMQVYYEIVLEREMVEVLEESVRLSEERLQLAEDKWDIGSGSKLEASLARVDYNADRSALISQQESMENSKIMLNRLLARDVLREFTVADTIMLEDTLEYGPIVERASAQNPALLIAGQNSVIAELEVRELRSEAYPVVGVHSSYEYSRFTSQSGFLESNRNLGFNYGFGISFNLFNGFNFLREMNNAKLRLASSDLQYDNIRNEVNGYVASTYNSYTRSLELLGLEEENLESARFNLEISKERHDIGDLPSIEYREAQTNFVEAESRYFNALYRAKASEIELLRLSGVLIEE